MNPVRVLIPFFILLLLCSCETFQEEEAIVCLPQNMSATIVQGSNTTKIIADYYYLPGTGQLDHITWSNHQTHSFEYNEAAELVVVRQMKVKEKVQDEMWFEYDGALVSKVILVKKNLDYTYLEPVDSAYTGHIDLEYEGSLIVRELRYGMAVEGGSERMISSTEYGYDDLGNILSSTISYEEDGKTETVQMTYDSGNHPFSGLRTYFSGESFVNNQLTKSSGFGNTEYQYDIRYNAREYPETIYEKLGSTHTRIIKYTYLYQ
ncbi:MAG: hypothetical protein V2B15_11310 [Bacteroidota bacterium]